jgi:hypothetical protein
VQFRPVQELQINRSAENDGLRRGAEAACVLFVAWVSRSVSDEIL